MTTETQISDLIFPIYQFLKLLPESLRTKTEDEAQIVCRNSLLEMGIVSPLNIDQSTIYLLLINARANAHVCIVVWRFLARQQSNLHSIHDLNVLDFAA